MASLHHLASGFELVTGGIALRIGLAAWRRRDQPGASAMIVVAAGAAGWAWSSGLSSLFPGPGLTAAFGFAVYPFALLAAVGWFLLAAAFTGRHWATERPVALALGGLVLLDVAVVATTGSHRLFATGATRFTSAGFLVPAPGPLYWAHTVLAFGMFGAGLALLVAELTRTRGVYREQTSAVIGGGLLTMALTGVEVFDLLPVPGLGIGVVGLTAGGLVVLWALYYADFLGVGRVGRDALVAEMDDAVFAVDAEDRLIDRNRAAGARFEVPDGAVGEPVSSALGAYPALVESLVAGPAGRTEIAVEHRDQTRHYEVRVSAVGRDRREDRLGGRSPPAGARIVVLRDVTARKERLRRLQQFRSVVETAGDPIIVVGADDTVEVVNGAMLDLLETQRAAVLGEVLDDVLPEAVARPTGRALGELRDGTRSGSVFEVEHTGRRGRARRYEAHLGRIPGETTDAGEADRCGAVGIFRDVTEHEERKTELDLLSQILTRVLRHNIRNDLNVIAGNAAVLRRRLDGEDAGMAGTIEDTARTVTDLADNAHTAHRITAAESTTTVLDLRRAVQVAVAAVTREHPDAAVQVDLPAVDVVAAQEFEIAVEHLVENAIVHNDRDEPTVTVTAAVEDDRVALEVADDGPGVDPSELAILDRDEETVLAHASGLGLWIVTWIVERSGGEIGFDADRSGTTVTVTLATPGAASRPADEPTRRPRRVGRSAAADRVGGWSVEPSTD